MYANLVNITRLIIVLFFILLTICLLPIGCREYLKSRPLEEIEIQLYIKGFFVIAISFLIIAQSLKIALNSLTRYRKENFDLIYENMRKTLETPEKINNPEVVNGVGETIAVDLSEKEYEKKFTDYYIKAIQEKLILSDYKHETDFEKVESIKKIALDKCKNWKEAYKLYTENSENSV
jgi:hypothetical protein